MNIGHSLRVWLAAAGALLRPSVRDLWLFSGLGMVGAGTWLVFGAGAALIAVGAVILLIAIWGLPRL